MNAAQLARFIAAVIYAMPRHAASLRAQRDSCASAFADALARDYPGEFNRQAFMQDALQRYVVDGAIRPNDPHGAEFAGDGAFAPFVIFDTLEQCNLPQRFDTRADAEAALSAMVQGVTP